MKADATIRKANFIGRKLCAVKHTGANAMSRLACTMVSSTQKQFCQHEHATSVRTADTMALVVTRRRIQVGRAIVLQWRVLSNLLRRIAASHSSKVFPI